MERSFDRPKPKERQAEQVREMFSRIAPRYDTLNHLLSLGLDISWRRVAARMVRQDRPLKVLDICGGTGDFAWQLHQQLPSAEIVVADFARPTLERAREKFFPRAQMTFVESDAQRLPFADKTFDILGCAFGVRNLTQLEQGIAEFHRVLKPDGQILILEFLGKQEGHFYRLFSWYFRRVLPLLGGWVSGDRKAYEYLPESVWEFASAEEFSKLLHRRGFQIKQVRNFAFGVCTLYYARRYMEEGGAGCA